MALGSLEVELRLFGVDNLKAKRHILQGLLVRLRQSYRVAAAEVDRQDDLRRASLEMACVAADGGQVRRVLDQVLRSIEGHGELEVLEHRLELW